MSELRWADNRYNSWISQSRALISMLPSPSRAIIFVHGWAGTAGDTWEAFPQGLRKLTATDCLWLNYPTVDHSVAFCAATLRMFIGDLLRRPFDTIVNPSLPFGVASRERRMTYEKVILVGHSMGAVVIRRALLDLELNDDLTQEDRDKISLLFFAPAHKGSSIPLMIASGIGLDFLPGAQLVSNALALWYRSLQDLKEGSQCLTGLEQDSRLVREERRTGTEYLRAHVYHAQGDKVVVQETFDRDHPVRPILKRNHRNICKPDDEYSEALEALEALL